MTITKQNTYLTLSGLMLLFIGGFIASTPSAYLLQFNPETQASISFLSELRAIGTGLLGVGLMATLSLFIPKLRIITLGASTIVFSSYFLGRMVSLIVDGMPNSGILIASIIEFIFTFAGLYLLKKEVKSWS